MKSASGPLFFAQLIGSHNKKGESLGLDMLTEVWIYIIDGNDINVMKELSQRCARRGL